MKALVFCVVIEIVTASSYINQFQYPNDGNQVRRFKFSHYLPLIPNIRQNDLNRFNDGVSVVMSYPQRTIHVSKITLPHLSVRVNKVGNYEEFRRLPYIIGTNVNRFVFKKIPKMLSNSKSILHGFLSKDLIYKGKVHINKIRNLIIKLLQGNGNDGFGSTNKTHQTGFTNFTTYRTRVSQSYQEILQNSTGLPLNYNLSGLENENENKLIKNIAKSKFESKVGVSGKNNQHNSKIIIKNVHVNVGGHVSNIASNNITKKNNDKASTNINLIRSSSKINNSNNNSKVIGKQVTIIIGKINSLNKNKDDQGMKPLLSQSDKSAVSAKRNTTLNHIEKYNIIHGNQNALYYALPNNNYHVHSKKVILTKNYPDFIKKSPEQESIIISNIKNTLGYHNIHKINQGMGHMEKTKYNNLHTYKTVKQDIKDSVTKNMSAKHTSNKDQNKKKQNDIPLEFDVEDLSESGLPHNLQKLIGSGKSNNKGKESSSSVIVNSKLNSGKESDQNNLRNKKDRGHEEPLEVKKIYEKNPHKITNFQINRENLLTDSMKPIEIEKTHKVIIEETKTIKYGDRSELYKKNYFTRNNKTPNLSAKNVYEPLLIPDYDSPTPVTKVIVSDKEISDSLKIKNNNGKSNLKHVILSNLSLSNDRNRQNKNSNNNKTSKYQSDLLHRKETILVSKNETAKNNLCIGCRPNNNFLRIKNVDGLLKKVQSTVHITTFNKNVKMGKNIQNGNLYWNPNANETSYRNKKHLHSKGLTGYKDIKNESINLLNRRTKEEDNTKETSNVMTNKDKVILNILAPESVKSDKKLLPYWLPSDGQEVYEILQQPSKDGAGNISLDLEMPLKEEIYKIVQLKKELGNENLEKIINLKVNTVGIGKTTNIIDKLSPSLYDVYLKNFITKILIRLRQKLSEYEYYQQKSDVKNLNINEISKANSILEIFQYVRDVFNKQDDEPLYELLVSLLRFNNKSDEDIDEEVKVILESVSRNSIYGVLKHYLVPEQKIDAVHVYLKQQELYPQFVYYKVLEDMLPNIRLIIINDLAILADKNNDINKNKDAMEELVKILVLLQKVMKDLGIPEETQRFIIEESVLDVVRSLANAYIKNYEKTVYVQIKKQLQDALYNNINV